MAGASVTMSIALSCFILSISVINDIFVCFSSIMQIEKHVYNYIPVVEQFEVDKISSCSFNLRNFN